MYGSFIDELNEKKNKNNKINLNEKFNDSIEYEKHIALYNTIINKKSYSERIKFLKKTVECFPNKIFAWIKILEISILKKDKSLFNFMLKEIPLKTSKDIRIQFLTNLNKIVFFNLKTDKNNIIKKLEYFIKDKNFFHKETTYIKLNQINDNISYNYTNQEKLRKKLCSFLPLFYDF